MAEITLEELHERTAEWLHGLQPEEELIITHKGLPLARIVAAEAVNPADLPPPPEGDDASIIVAGDRDGW
jgi:antitoxin (DNA-binding transcriptional repressor) of toxin-antitoxin stability system